MENKEHFVDSLAYEIELVSRVCHESFKRWFEANAKGITPEEFSILDTIDLGKNLSQIELANMMLKGKAHTGKFLDSLEKKGLITRLYDTKNSRMVKIPVMTELGTKTYNELRVKIEKISDRMNKVYPKKDIINLKNELKKFRETIIEMEKISFN